MPRRDGTGPEEKGPGTGRSMGPCVKKDGKRITRGPGLGRGKRFFAQDQTIELKKEKEDQKDGMTQD